MQWLAETEAITGYRSTLTRTFAPLSRASAAARGQPSAWPTGSGATHTPSLAGEAGVEAPAGPLLRFFLGVSGALRPIAGARSLMGGPGNLVSGETSELDLRRG